MRFPVMFRREKGGASSDPALGSDSDPRTTQKPPVAGTDNLLTCKLRDPNGWPTQRICIAWTTTAAAPTALNANLFFWEDRSLAWYLINSAPVSMSEGQLYFFDTCTILEPTPLGSSLTSPNSNPPSAGSMELLLVLSDPGAQVNGVFVVVMGPDMTTVGT
jgi:hypothetical protein